MSKFSDFVIKHGYTYKSFFLVLLVFPPGALVIAWKIPNVSILIRIFLTVLGVIVPLLPFILGGLGLSKIFS